MSLDRLFGPLPWVAALHLVVGLGCLCLLATNAAPIAGAHPALKPMKFGLSIALFLGTMAVVLPSVSMAPATRSAVAWVLCLTMLIEMALIVAQALRGTTSHFNMRTTLDAAVWRGMMAAIVVATITMIGVATLATLRPMTEPDGAAMTPLLATAWRAALWLFLLVAFSGFSMGGRGQHSVGGADGGAGVPVLGWSTRHGDLRVSHFLAMHAMQIFPLLGLALEKLPIGEGARWTGLLAAIGAHVIVSVATLLQALASRPVW